MSWFPLRADLIENPEFVAMSPSQKVYYLALVSEFNLRGEFYRSDQEFAVLIGAATDKEPVKYPFTLDRRDGCLYGVSVDTIRRARRELQKKGWIAYKPGTRSRRGTVATTYKQVRHARAAEEMFFAPMHRHTFDMLLDQARRGQFTHADLVAYTALVYWGYKHGRPGDFFITKGKLRELTGLESAPDHVARLHDRFKYAGGRPLFDYQDTHQRLRFTEWRTAADPEKDETNREIAKRWEREVEAATQAARQAKERRQRVNVPPALAHEPAPEDLLKAFEELFRQRYGDLSGAGVREAAARELLKLGRRFGAPVVLKALLVYFRAADVPNRTGANRRTLRNFLENWPMLYRTVQRSSQVS